jgi:hypothetical protein
VAAPTIRGTPASNAGATNSTSSPTITVPAAAVAGDYAWYVVTFSANATVTPPAGWSLIGSGSVNNNNFLFIYSKTLDAGDLGGTLQSTSSLGGSWTASCIVFNGASGLDAISTVSTKSAASTSITIPAITPTVGDTLLVYVVSSSASALSTTISLSTPTGFTEDVDNTTTGPAGAAWRGHAIGHQGLTGQAGVAQGPFAATESTATRDVVFAATIAPVGLAGPTGLTATAVSSSQINVDWDPTVGALAYDVERNGVIVSSPATDFLADTGLLPSTAYSYRVRSTN